MPNYVVKLWKNTLRVLANFNGRQIDCSQLKFGPELYYRELLWQAERQHLGITSLINIHKWKQSWKRHIKISISIWNLSVTHSHFWFLQIIWYNCFLKKRFISKKRKNQADFTKKWFCDEHFAETLILRDSAIYLSLLF